MKKVLLLAFALGLFASCTPEALNENDNTTEKTERICSVNSAGELVCVPPLDNGDD